MKAYARLLRHLGCTVNVAEIPIGAKPGGNPQRIDAVATNWMAQPGRTRLGIDATVGGALLQSKLRRAAREDGHVTRELEKAKESLKGQLCRDRQPAFLTVALDSNSALGAEAAKIIVEGYAEKVATAKTDGEKWATIQEKTYHLTTLSIMVQRRNAYILLGNAAPMGGGLPPRSEQSFEFEEAEPMLEEF